MSRPLIKQLTVGPYQVLTYLLICPQSKKAAIVDPGDEAERIFELVQAEGVELTYILNTHGHPDHCGANQRLSQLSGAPVAMHTDDVLFFQSEQGRQVASQELGLAPPEPPDVMLQHGDRLKLGGLEIEVVHTPGHSPGSVCFLVEGNLFTGDTLFVGAVGRTDLGGASLQELLSSLEKRILPLDQDTVIWPGHDYGERPSSTLAQECQENPYITDFILD